MTSAAVHLVVFRGSTLQNKAGQVLANRSSCMHDGAPSGLAFSGVRAKLSALLNPTRAESDGGVTRA